MKEARDQKRELFVIVEERLVALVQELGDAGWSLEEAAFVIRDVLQVNYLDQAEARKLARGAAPKNFISDGNEG